MSDSEDRNRMDVLDAALEAYRQVRPPTGLQERILEKVEANRRRRRFRMRFLMAATAGAAAAGLLLLFISPRPVALRESATVNVPTEQRHAAAEPAVRHSIRPQQREPRVVVETTSPRHITFPAPSPLSDQERVLISLMQSRQEILVAISQSRSPEVAPEMDIAPIRLEPLADTGESSVLGR